MEVVRLVEETVLKTATPNTGRGFDSLRFRLRFDYLEKIMDANTANVVMAIAGMVVTCFVFWLIFKD